MNTRIHPFSLGILLAVAGHGAPSAAQGTDESAFFSDFPKVLTASRLDQQPENTAAAVTVIDRETISASGARNIPELLRLVPGFQVAPVAGYLFSATYHGLADDYSRRMQVLVDGRSVYQRLIGGVSWELLPVDVRDVERIEVVRGPNSVAYGANAFLGVINIITRHPGVYPGAHLAVNAGSNGIADLWATYNATFSQGAFSLSAAQRRDDGISTLYDDSTHRHVRARLDYSASPSDTLEFEAAFTRAELQDGHEDAYLFLPNDPIGESVHAAIRWQHSHGNGTESVLHAFAIEETLDETRVGTPLSETFPLPTLAYPVDAGGRVTRYEVEFHQIVPATDTLRLVWGGTVRNDEVDTPLFFNGQHDLKEDLLRVFAHTEWEVAPDTVLNAGALVEENEFTGSEVDFRFGVNHKLTPGHTLRAAVSSATRTPLFFEEKGDLRVTLDGPGLPPFPLPMYVGNEDLAAEKILSTEIGYLFSNGNLNFDLRLFYDEFDDLIHSTSTGPSSPITWTGDNGSVTHRGAEAQVDWRPSSHARILATYSYVDAQADVDDFEDSTPRHTASLFGSYRFRGSWLLSGGYYYTSPFRWLGLSKDQPTMNWLDLRLSKTLRLGDTNAEIAVVGRNLLGDTTLYFAGEGTNELTNEIEPEVFATVSMSF